MIKNVLLSFMRLPMWVRFWVALILVPINMGGLLFLDHPVGRWSAFLGIIAMIPNIFIMIHQQGLSKAMALPHLLPWSILVVWLLVVMTGPEAPTGPLGLFLWALIATDSISLILDYKDAYQWWRGARNIA